MIHMTQPEFIWKMKSKGIDVVQRTDTVVQAVLAPDVLLEHYTTYALGTLVPGSKTMITLILGELGTETEVDYPVDNDLKQIDSILKIHESNGTVDDYRKLFY